MGDIYFSHSSSSASGDNLFHLDQYNFRGIFLLHFTVQCKKCTTFTTFYVFSVSVYIVSIMLTYKGPNLYLSRLIVMMILWLNKKEFEEIKFYHSKLYFHLHLLHEFSKCMITILSYNLCFTSPFIVNLAVNLNEKVGHLQLTWHLHVSHDTTWKNKLPVFNPLNKTI